MSGVVMDKHFKKLTIKEMCQVMELAIPEHMKIHEDLIITHVALIASHVENGSAYFVCVDNPNVSKVIQEAMLRNVSVIFISEKAFRRSGLNEQLYPVIFTDDWMVRLEKLYAAIRYSYNATIVAITGTVGKTTTKDFISSILKTEQNIFCSTGNRNTFYTAAKHITEELNEETDTFIQEMGAANPMSVEKAASMLNPNYFILLNVKNHHLNTYKTFDALFKDKTSVDKHMPEDGIIITNYDDEAIANHHFQHKVISFGITTDKKVDYRAVNIVEKNCSLFFDIVSKTDTFSVQINILGRHNVYNAMAAIILAKELSIPTSTIINNLKHYQTTGIRQNYQNVGGYHLFVDCYNVAFDSIQAGIDTLCNFTLKNGARRFIVLGGENKLGSDGPSLSYEFGQKIANTNIDFFYCYGREERSLESLDTYGDAWSICEGINSIKKNKANFIMDPDILIERLKKEVSPGDIIFFKGIYLLDMPYIIDKVFGSSFTAKSDHYAKDAVYIKSDTYTFKKLPIGDELEICGSQKRKFHLTIPNEFEGLPVYRVSESAFEGRKYFKVNFGNNLTHIAADAFKKCYFINSLLIPSNIFVIERRAFTNCTRLKKVILENGVRHIGRRAFRKCKNLKEIYLPDSIGYIDDTAFEECSKLTIHCSKNSYAEYFAQKTGIPYLTDL